MTKSIKKLAKSCAISSVFTMISAASALAGPCGGYVNEVSQPARLLYDLTADIPQATEITINYAFGIQTIIVFADGTSYLGASTCDL